MSIHIHCSNNSVHDTKFSCDSLGIHYTVSRTGGITSVSRWDSKTDMNVVVGEFELPFIRKDRIRVGPNGEWQPMIDFLRRPDSSNPLAFIPLSFTANDGMEYTWRASWSKLKMTRASSDEVLTTYNHHKSGSSYLEISDSSVLNGLDTILFIFLIAESKRRTRKIRRRAAIAGVIGGAVA